MSQVQRHWKCKEILKGREMHAEIERKGLLDETLFLDMLNMNMEKKAIDCSEEIRRKEEIRRRRGVRRRRMRTKSKKNRMRRRAIGKQKTF